MPKYLSFVKGVVDSDDLPLNVNRETLQESKIIKIISKKLVRKVVELMKKLSDEDAKGESEKKEDEEETAVKEDSKWIKFYKKFNPSIKMGVIEDDANRNKLAKLLLFKSSKFSKEEDWISLEDYVGRMKDWQKEIFFYPGESLKEMEQSHFMDRFKEKDVEVLYFTDPMDEYMIQSLPSFDGKRFQAITKEGVKFGDEDEDLVKRREKAYSKKFKPLTKFLKNTYGDSVSRVIVSKRLGEAPAIISTVDWTHSANMERLMKAQAFHHGRDQREITAMKVFEINPRHPFVTKLLSLAPPEDEEEAKEFVVAPSTLDAAWMLHDMALLNSGFTINKVKSFSKRMTRVIQSHLGLDTLTLEEEISVPEEEDVPPDVDETAGGLNMEDFDFDLDANDEL